MQLHAHQNSNRQFDQAVVIVNQAVDFCLIRSAKFNAEYTDETSDIPVTETQTDTEMIDFSKTHTETNTEKIFNTDTVYI